jgi:Cu-Zn family superoxide dismutase
MNDQIAKGIRMKALLAIIAVLSLIGSQNSRAQMNHGAMHGSAVSNAVAVLSPTKDSKVSGIVTFEAVQGGVRVVAHISGLTPGKHGFHIHEYGDCSSENGLSAGGHFNPTNMPHSMPANEKRHVGDLGNITAGPDGKAELDYVDPVLAFSGENSIIGRGVILHEKEDDLKTQPTGDAGGRLACGVIGVKKGE